MSFKSFRPPNGQIPFFAKQITYRKAELYYSNKNRGFFYFKKNNEHTYYVIDLESEILLQSTEYNNQDIKKMNTQNLINPDIPNITSNEDAFRNFFIYYFKNKTSIVNKLKREFYNFYDIETMFKEYNGIKN